jgi:uncharacterized membrane protein
MQKQLLSPFYLIAATLIGLGDTAYLAYFHFLNKIPSCAIGGCEVVLTSKYANFFDVPLSYIGLLYYAVMLFLLIFLAIDPYSKGLRLAVLTYAGIGLLLSIYFEFYIQGVLIGSYCMYCAISALVLRSRCLG